MESGKVFDKLLGAVRDAEASIPYSVSVLISRKRWFPFPRFSAQRLYRAAGGPDFFIFIHLPCRRYTWTLSPELERAVDKTFWRELEQKFVEDLQSTHFENALCLLIQTLRVTLMNQSMKGTS